MTSTAADSRYGRQGGRWAETRSGDGICHTCRNGNAAWTATHTDTGEQWQVCHSCRQQAARTRAHVTHQPIERRHTCPDCGHTFTTREMPARCPRCRLEITEAAQMAAHDTTETNPNGPS